MARDSGTYEYMVERIPTYFNDFIPRGLFHDLMDDNTLQENHFDLTKGYSILQIYNSFNDNTYTIQKFRKNWED